MSFFDEFSQKAKTFTSVAQEKTKDAVDIAKITAAIVSERRELDRMYRAIGEWFANSYEGEVPLGVADLMDAVKASQERIEELQKRKSAGDETASTGAKDCPICGVRTSGRFCPHCGAPLE